MRRDSVKISALRCAPILAICRKPISKALNRLRVLVSVPMPRAHKTSCASNSISSFNCLLSMAGEGVSLSSSGGSMSSISSSKSPSMSSSAINCSANSGSSWIFSSRKASSLNFMVSSVPAIAKEDDASSLRRISSVRCRWRFGMA